jgi:hypothetical protein
MLVSSLASEWLRSAAATHEAGYRADASSIAALRAASGTAFGVVAESGVSSACGRSTAVAGPRAASARSSAGLGAVSNRAVTALAIDQAAALGLASASSSVSGSTASGSCATSLATKCDISSLVRGESIAEAASMRAGSLRCFGIAPSLLEEAAVARNSASSRLVMHASIRARLLVTMSALAVARMLSYHVRRERESL